MKHLVCIALLCSTTGLAWAGSFPTLPISSLDYTVTAGENVTVDLNISGTPGSMCMPVECMEVGAFDVFLGFNPALLTPTGANFTLRSAIQTSSRLLPLLRMVHTGWKQHIRHFLPNRSLTTCKNRALSPWRPMTSRRRDRGTSTSPTWGVRWSTLTAI